MPDEPDMSRYSDPVNNRLNALTQRVDSWFSIFARIFPDVAPGTSQDRDTLIHIRSAIEWAVKSQSIAEQIKQQSGICNNGIGVERP